MKYAIALDIGGTSIKYALVNQEGQILYQSSVSSCSSGNHIRLSIKVRDAVREMYDYSNLKGWELYGIGVGVPSVVENGMILFANNLPELDNKQLTDSIAEFNLPIYLENDASLMALGEMAFGSAKGLSDVVFLTVGTGIGGALCLNGQLYNGYRNRGTELGHIIIHGQNGNQCTCGAVGCLEAHASVTALISLYSRLIENSGKSLPDNLNGKFIIDRYCAGEKEAVLAMEDHFYNMSLGVLSYINIFAPQKVIIGGGISESGDYYIENIRKHVKKMVMKETSCFTTIESAALGNVAGCIGAAQMVFNH